MPILLLANTLKTSNVSSSEITLSNIVGTAMPIGVALLIILFISTILLLLPIYNSIRRSHDIDIEKERADAEFRAKVLTEMENISELLRIHDKRLRYLEQERRKED